MFLLLLLVVSLPPLQAEIYAGDKFFDSSDRLKADCVPPAVASTYHYLGDRSHNKDGHSCLSWNEAFLELQKTGHPVRESPPMRSLHSKCRTLDTGEVSSAASGQNGPWCWIRSQANSLVASECFNPCAGPSQRNRARKKPHAYGKLIHEGNYNYALVDNMQKYYLHYKWGDEAYYQEKPSEKAYSDEYYRIRQQIFFGCLGALGLIALWILGCYTLKKRALASRRRREMAIQEMCKEDHGRIPEVLSRPAPN